MKHFGDITQLDGHELPVADCIIGGSPCQDLSVAGKREGLQGARSGLFMEQVRIVKEMREQDVRTTGRSGFLVRPRYLVWENVPGCQSSGTPKGADFQAVLQEICKIVCKEAPAVPIPKDGWPKAGCISGVGDSGCTFSIAWRLHDAQFWGVPQRRKRIALVADFGGLAAPEVLFERKGLRGDIAESGEAGETVAPGIESGSDSTICLQGNGIDRSDNAGCGGRGWRRGASYTLNTLDRPAVLDTATASVHQNASGEVRVSDKAYTVSTNSNASGRNTPLVFENHGQDARYKPLRTVCETVSRKYGTGGNNAPLVANENKTSGYVRRLTPKECERLQGFPDDWSKYGVNDKGEVYELSDSARYRLQGNGIATPFWKYLLKRISAQYERDPTMGSLFDGQASFPMLWEGINGEGTCLWSSEIDKHAVAVAKYHFPEDAEV